MKMLLAALCLTSVPVSAATVHRFDMGSGAVENGYTPVHHDDVYGASGWGWVAPDVPFADRDQGAVDPIVAHTSRTKVLVDSVVTQGGPNATCVFRVDVDPGVTYQCLVLVGDVGTEEAWKGVSMPGQHTPLEELGVDVDAGAGYVTIADDLIVRTIYSKGGSLPFLQLDPNPAKNFQTSTGGYLKLRFQVEVPAGPSGAISLRFRSRPGVSAFSYVSVQGIEIEPYAEPPIRFDHASGQLVSTSASPEQAVTDFLTHMANADYDAARLAIDSIGDPLTVPNARLWLAGWLAGYEEELHDGGIQGVDLALAIDELDTYLGSTPGDVAARRLLDQAADFQAAVYHDLSRGYLSDEVDVPTLPVRFVPIAKITGCKPQTPGYFQPCLIKRLGAAEQLFRQVGGDLFDAADHPAIEVSPLQPRADYRRVSQYFGRATKTIPADVGAGADPNPANFWTELIGDIATRSDVFPLAANMWMFHHMADNYYQIGQPSSSIIQSWNGSGSHNYDPASTWWGAEGWIPDNSVSGPDWATALRGYLFGLTSIAGWWMDRRLHSGELGGGDGDDVELVGALWGSPRVFSPDAVYVDEGAIEADLRSASDEVLFGPSVNQAQGYFQGQGDSEHAGEFTSHPLFGVLPARFGDPNYLEIAARMARNLEPASAGGSDDAPWLVDKTGGGPETRWMFKSYTFGATSVSSAPGQAFDAPINLRAIMPLFHLADFNGDDYAVELLRNIANTWRFAAMDTSPGATIPKPVGIPPAAILSTPGFPPTTYGTAGKWWENSYIDSPQYLEMTYQLFSTAYRHTGDVDYLKPLYESAKLAYQYRFSVNTPASPLDPDNPLENEEWAAVQFRNAIVTSLSDARDDLFASGLLVGNEENQFKQLIGLKGNAWDRFTLTKNKGELAAHFVKADTWLRYFWPLATEAVEYTDRVYFSIANSFKTMYGAISGDTFVPHPRPIVSWENPDPESAVLEQQNLDIAPLVLHADPGELHLLVHSFAGVPIDVAFRIWGRLELGDWDYTVGVDADEDDEPDAASPVTVQLDEHGQRFQVTLSPGATTVVKLVRQPTSPPAPTPVPVADPGIGLRDVAHDGSTVYARVHNVGTANAPADVRVQLSSGGTPLGSTLVPAAQLRAPVDLAPSSAVVPVGPVPAGTADLDLVVSFDQGTVLNDAVSVELGDPFAATEVATACGGGCGSVPTISATAPFLGSDDFTVDLGNATGTTAFLFIGASGTVGNHACGQLLATPLFVSVPLNGSELSVPIPLNDDTGALHPGLELWFQFAAYSPSCTTLTDVLRVTLL